MPTRKLTNDELKKKRVSAEVTKFMDAVKAFIKSKNNGEVPLEWGASLMLLKSYYEEFLMLSQAIDEMDDYVFVGRYGPQPSPLLTARNSAAIRLESCLDKYGLNLKSATKMNVVEVKPESSPLEDFIKNKSIEQR